MRIWNMLQVKNSCKNLKLKLNHMAGPRGPIGPWLSHKLCNIINVTPTLSTKATINCSHHELHSDIQFFFNGDAISHFKGTIFSF